MDRLPICADQDFHDRKINRSRHLGLDEETGCDFEDVRMPELALGHWKGGEKCRRDDILDAYEVRGGSLGAVERALDEVV